jgi:hypothetical protein
MHDGRFPLRMNPPMKSLRFVILVLIAAAIALVASLVRAADADAEGFMPMFNGKDLSGWVNANCAPETWAVKDGIITCTGVPTGAMRTEKQYENFIMEAEWRHLKPGGNSGIFIWGTPISSPGVPFLRGIEVQILDHGYLKNADPKKARWFSVHGDVFPIHGATMEPHGEHNGMRSFPSEERSKPSPEWNHYRIEANAGRITLAVNGKVVSGGDNCVYRKGYLALESEGAPVEFRNVRIKELPPTNTPAEQTAPLNEGWQHLYNGVDLRGWKVPNGRWQAANWMLRLKAGEAGAPLQSEVSLADGQVICDVQIPKDADLSKPIAGLCVRGQTTPLVVIGAGKAAIVLGADQVQPGKWYRIKATLKGKSAKVVITEQQDANPRSFEATLEATDGGPIGLADYGVMLSYANVFISSTAW